MGSELDKSSSPTNYTEVFEKMCPYYLAIGMSYEQYWDGASEIAKYYREAYDIKIQQHNQEEWLQGLYIYEALCDVAPVLHAFAKKGTKVRPYSKEPYPINQKEYDNRENTKLAKHRENLKLRLEQMAKRGQESGEQ